MYFQKMYLGTDNSDLGTGTVHHHNVLHLMGFFYYETLNTLLTQLKLAQMHWDTSCPAWHISQMSQTPFWSTIASLQHTVSKLLQSKVASAEAAGEHAGLQNLQTIWKLVSWHPKYISNLCCGEKAYTMFTELILKIIHFIRILVIRNVNSTSRFF